MTLTFHHSKCAAPWDTHACQISSCYLQYCKSIHKMSDFGHIYLTSDLEGWPWPFTAQNVQLHEIHMHAKYQVAILNIEILQKCTLNERFWPIYLTFDLEGWPWPFTTQNVQLHEIQPNIKLLSSILQKLWPMLKLAQSNKPTDRAKTICPPVYTGGHKKGHNSVKMPVRVT